jgi:hypothetical protein
LADSLPSSRDLLSLARSAEERYDWMISARLYRQVIDSEERKEVKNTFPDLEERIAICHMRSAFQAEDSEEFNQRIDMAIRAYEKTEVSRQAGEEDADYSEAVSLYFRAKAAQAKSWIASDSELRTNLLSESMRLAEEAFGLFEDSERFKEIVKCCGHLLLCLEELAVIELNGKSLQTTINKALSYGRKALEILSSTIEDERELCRMYCMTAWFCGLGRVLFESQEFRSSLSKMKDDYRHKFEVLAARLGDPILLEESLLRSGEDKTPEEVAGYARDILPKVLKTEDNLLIAGLHAQITYGLSWAPLREEDPQKLVGTRSELEKSFNESTRRYSLVRPVGIHWEWLAYSHSSLAQYLFFLARSETEAQKREELLDKALEICRSSLENLRPYTSRIARYLEFAIALALKDKAELHPQPERKLALLEEALTLASEFVTSTNELEPHRHWDCGIALASLARVKFERSNVEENSNNRISLLRSSIETSGRGIELLTTGMEEQESFESSVIVLGAIAFFLEEQDGMWKMLYQLTGDTVALTKRLGVLEETRELYDRANLISRIAESHWEMGSVYALLLDHFSASKSYERAAEYFLRASEKMAPLRDYYIDYSAYMQAWAEIEKARALHEEEDYLRAKVGYDGACSLLEKTRRWKHLVSHFHGSALLEEAENLSRADVVADIEQSIECFQDAAGLFASSYQELSERVQTEDPKEGESASLLEKTSRVRKEYCEGRVHFELARLHYRKGDRDQSMREYSTAAEILERVAEAQQNERERREIEAIALSCRAWEKVQEAEFKVSAELCRDASNLFVKASEAVTKEKAALVAKGNASFCKAMTSTLEFRDKWRIDDYVIAKSHLSQAADDYSRAGLELAAEWFRATERIVDAYVYINNALKETEPERRAKNFLAAEKILIVAASIYEKAGYEAKRNETLSILKKIREESEFALSLVDVFASQTTPPNTASLLIPAQAREEPSGLSQFKGANVQLAVSLPNEIRADEEFQIRLDLINTGKKHALLHKVENLLPKGLRIVGQQRPPIKEDGSIEFRGKRLGPLEIEPIVFSAKSDADIDFTPKVHYSDESGALLTSSLYPVRVVARAPKEFKFRSEKTKVMFDCLVDAFVQDYMTKKFHTEKSGWRSLVEISRETGISSSTIYARKGGMSPLLGELVQRGLAEARVFTGERGRGGEVTRLRIAYEKEPVKDYVNQRIRIKT